MLGIARPESHVGRPALPNSKASAVPMPPAPKIATHLIGSQLSDFSARSRLMRLRWFERSEPTKHKSRNASATYYNDQPDDRYRQIGPEAPVTISSDRQSRRLLPRSHPGPLSIQ